MPKDDVTWVAGVDEAGRGPVIGPMVMAAVAVPASEQAKLAAMGVRDSKKLTKEQREAIYPKLQKFPHVQVELTAEEITRAMRADISLNELEARFAGQALSELHGKQPFATVILDSPDRPPEKYAVRVKKYFSEHKSKKVKVISENYADANHPVVAAASILAKVKRDALLDDIKKIAGWDFGSGYSHEEAQIEKLLKAHYDDPKLAPFIRWEWMTVKKFERKHRKTPHHKGALADFME